MQQQQDRAQQIYNHLYPTTTGTSSDSIVELNLTSSTTSTASATPSSSSDIVIYQPLNKNGIVVLYLNDGPVNALSDRFLKAIKANIERANNDDQCKAVIIASKLKGFFVAGADITEIRKRQSKSTPPSDSTQFLDFIKNGNGLMNYIENSPKNKPIVSCIDGVALGGGLELAMSTNGRVCSETSAMGLPETNLGIIPGYGGCNRYVLN